jgi:nitrate/nitrite transporter NarK
LQVAFIVEAIPAILLAFVVLAMMTDRPSLATWLAPGTAAAGGIALVNSIGNLGGYVGPFIVGWIKDATGSFEAGLYFLAACALLSSIIAYLAVQPTERTSAPSGLAAAAR